VRLLIQLIFRVGIIELFLLFFVAVNLLTFFLYLMDKRRAVKGKWRIRERVLLFFTLACGGIGAVLGMWVLRHKTQNRKFRVVAVIGLVIALIPVIHIVEALTIGGAIRYVEVEFRSERWPAELDGYRIAFMTDFHVIPDEDMRGAVAELNRRDIDLLLLGGDFSMRGTHYQGTLREIARAVVTDGIFGVEGNHDAYGRLFHAMEQHGMIPLDNSGVRIRDGFYLAGVQDMWNRSPDVAEAIFGADGGEFVLLLTHNPDVTMAQSTVGVDFVFAGHTHSGQITFFGFPMYLLRGSITGYGTRFGHGFADSADGVPVFTSSGIGVYYGVPRIFARPEVVIVTMYSEQR